MRTYTYIPGRALPVAIDLGRQEKRIPPISRDAALLPAGGGRGIWLFLRRAPGPPRYGRRPLAPRRTGGRRRRGQPPVDSGACSWWSSGDDAPAINSSQAPMPAYL